jgi:hypothetical protein
MAPDSSLGFAPADWLLLLLTAIFIATGFAWRPRMQRGFTDLSQRTRLCLILLFCLPILLRLLLLNHHPVPSPAIYDEFSHLLEADTLIHGRFANPPHPMHRFFETFFVLQEPSYSSIYPLGQGLMLAFGRLISGLPWTGVLICSGTLCAGCYWMLRGWVPPNWALLGGLLAVAMFGPLCLWTNSYWGGSFAATGGCLAFGALPRICDHFRLRDGVLLGVGFGMHVLSRQFESLLLLASISLFFLPVLFKREERARALRPLSLACLTALPLVPLILLQNKAVTGCWTILPEQWSQYQYGVPTSLTIEPTPRTHAALTPQQELDYQAQTLTHGVGTDSIRRFLLRLEFRVRDYRFFFLPPLYIAIPAFFFGFRNRWFWWVALTLAIFALGTNLFPYLLVHYLAAVTCLFMLVSVTGLQQIAKLRVHGATVGLEVAGMLIVLCLAEFSSWYVMHLFESSTLYAIMQFETWDSISHTNLNRRLEVAKELSTLGGPLLVFVRYSAHHPYQDEWVWNAADIDAAQVVFARDLGSGEDEKLKAYYPNRKVFLLEPDGEMPTLRPYSAGSR